MFYILFTRRFRMKEMNTLEFVRELEKRRSINTEKTPTINLDKKDVFSESCLGLCVE